MNSEHKSSGKKFGSKPGFCNDTSLLNCTGNGMDNLYHSPHPWLAAGAAPVDHLKR